MMISILWLPAAVGFGIAVGMLVPIIAIGRQINLLNSSIDSLKAIIRQMEVGR